MNKELASKIAETITNEQLKAMFDKARAEIKDWKVVSNVNLGFTKGVAWNVLALEFDVKKTYPNIAKTNMVREFGEFLPDELIPKKDKTKKEIIPTHQDPIFK